MLNVASLRHRYDVEPVLNDISFSLGRGRIGCLLGASGCGKTTLLRIIAGFESADAGTIELEQRLLNGPGIQVPPASRGVGMVFQDYALLPHLSVWRNVGFGLNLHDKAATRRRVGELLELVGLTAQSERYPHELSGGQQQRVAIARALAPGPKLLLMDEPFSNLDASLRQRLGREVRDLLKLSGATVLMVTHDHKDALALADDVGVMHEGRLLQWSNAYELYHQPRSRRVAEAVGIGAWLPGEVVGPNEIRIEIGIAEGVQRLPLPDGSVVDLLLRPDDVIHDDDSATKAVVVSRQFHGADFLYELRLPSGQQVFSSVPSHHNHAVGEPIGIRLDTDHLVAFKRNMTD